MHFRNAQNIDSHASAMRYLGRRDERRITPTMTVHRDGDDVAVRYHATDIVTYHADGTITLDHGGYCYSPMTTMRLHALTPGNVRVRRTDGHTAYKVTGDLERYLFGPTRIEV